MSVKVYPTVSKINVHRFAPDFNHLPVSYGRPRRGHTSSLFKFRQCTDGISLTEGGAMRDPDAMYMTLKMFLNATEMPDYVGDLEVTLSRFSNTRGIFLSDMTRDVGGILCVSRENVIGGELQFESEISDFKVDLEPKNIVIFSGVEVYQSSIRADDVDFDGRVDIVQIRAISKKIRG
jgi:hypothetical protein